MANNIKKPVMLCSILSTVAFAQPYDANTVDELDMLERQRILLQKQLEVAQLESSLSEALASSGATRVVGKDNMITSALNLVKVTGLAKNPEAIFTYGGYRIVTRKGEMVLPNIQVSTIDTTHVVLKDVTTGKESVLWLSNATVEKVNSGPFL